MLLVNNGAHNRHQSLLASREQVDKRQGREALAAKLKEAGYNVARRTVAKYRDMLGLPTARLRKE